MYVPRDAALSVSAEGGWFAVSTGQEGAHPNGGHRRGPSRQRGERVFGCDRRPLGRFRG